MGLNLTSKKLAEYRRGALARRARDKTAIEQRRLHAWEVARKAAELLKQEYGATRVLAFGSVLYSEDFGPHSDVDLAVLGIRWPEYFRACAAVERLTHEFKIDLIDLDTVSERFRERVITRGQAL